MKYFVVYSKLNYALHFYLLLFVCFEVLLNCYCVQFAALLRDNSRL